MRVLMAFVAGLLAASVAWPAAAQDDLATLSDEFDGGSLSGWTWFHEAYGWPNKVKKVDVGVTTPGTLHIEPYHSGWIYDLNAPFLFREVHGDFDVRARVRVRGAEKAIAGGTWSLGGLMARVPNKLDSKTWVPRSENWHFLTTGVGYVAGQQMTEAKSTFNSYSSLKLRPFPSGWVELRMVRVGVSIIVMARPEGETAWQVRDRFYRMESNPVMQVGLNAYTISDNVPIGADNPDVVNRTVNRDAPVDMILEVDWIRFSRPKVQVPPDWYTQVSANPLADPGLPEADLLAMLGN
ncbi:hypothetical protein OSH11_13655 [Kaistia dalseonensis]|uniref:Regulation of enolase protein 1 (Concanavalin A-like superfamily) n=1 Tax=Kaistia dalseonensis TaxID=410840 RepID=A0ABU0H7R7_9HYPH|nr:hypothetical protein [Kaistia dalseonensis]MCX5495754.1 hypothetical protein [Kaistia dalseonensis]MDQ0438354.1 regulation of enolase protein 1 (concanavalin A-like superfamily) [Kaistia dalseonensis]